MSLESGHRNTIYPGLEDHELVHHYPPVRGMAQNLFFLTHNHRENDGGEESASKYNTYEVNHSGPYSPRSWSITLPKGRDDSRSCPLSPQVRSP